MLGLSLLQCRLGLVTCGCLILETEGFAKLCFAMRDTSIESHRTLSHLAGKHFAIHVVPFRSVRVEVGMMKLQISNFLIDRSFHHSLIFELACGTLETHISHRGPIKSVRRFVW